MFLIGWRMRMAVLLWSVVCKRKKSRGHFAKVEEAQFNSN
jgi:hypothetical protein